MAEFMKCYDQLGQVRLGSQLRILADRVTADAATIYQQFDVDLDPKWFPVFYVLASEQDASVTSIAQTIGHSHVSVSKIISELEAARLIISKRCASDSRRTLINLSRTGRELVPKLQLQCEAVDAALSELTKEIGVNVWSTLRAAERSLTQTPLSERIKAMQVKETVQIVDFQRSYSGAFRDLNEAWITEHWELEEADRTALENPSDHIIEPGGAILIALEHEQPIGTVALIRKSDSVLELAKMAVSPKAQGRGIGFALAEAALARAGAMGATTVYLESNSKLGPALSLYRKLGFREVDGYGMPSPYSRCNVCMEKRLQPASA